MTDQKYSDLLAQALTFMPDDLALNEHGIISPMQHERLQQMLTDKLIEDGKITLFVTVVLAGLTFLARDYLALAPWLLILLVGGPVLLIVYFLWQWWRIRHHLTRDQHEQIAETVSGRVTLAPNLATHDQTLPYMLSIEDRTFPISEKAFLAFKNGDPYQIYYAPHTRILLSAVWLAEQDLFDTAPYHEVSYDIAD